MLQNKKDSEPREMRVVHGNDAVVRVAANWGCPCGKRDFSPFHFHFIDHGAVTAICSLCHVDLFTIEPVL
jgi:hypothetical protein